MSRRWLLSLLCLALLFFSLDFFSLDRFTRARGELRVDEAGSSISFGKDPAEVLLAVENPAAKLDAKVQVELLDASNKKLATATLVQSIASGSHKLRLSLPFQFPRSTEADRNRVLWHRLHYRLSPQDSAAETLAEGFISVSELARDLFELHIAATGITREGDRYYVRVVAAHPVTNQPAANVRIDAQVALEQDENNLFKLTGSGLTDEKGRVSLEFVVPARFPKYPHPSRPAGGELQVTGTRGAIVVRTEGDILVDQFARFLITTDKPIYQPGQLMHLRALVLTPSKRALANHEIFFKICDPDGTTMYRTAVTSSRFGVATADWSIPENTRLGSYRVWVGIEGGDDQTAQDVRISRYELPNFRVNVEPDRKFYLPGQNASVTVKAEYLFGQPVLRGKVRVVRESDRSWNYREQKWEVDEEGEQKGVTNADGSFVAKLDLSEQHKALADYPYNQFKDYTYAAYFTDPTTNRTEQRRFDVRVTINPIHVYVVQTYDWSYNRTLPLTFFVSTFYADGSPARTTANVTFTEYADQPKITKHIATVTTNSYGLAKITTLVPAEFKNIDSIDVVVSATDSSGQKGSEKDDFRFDDDPSVRVETNKTIYRPGEPIEAVILSSIRDATIRVDLAGEGAGVIRSERVELSDGRGSITFPFQPEFKNRLSVVAYPESAISQGVVSVRTVIYPHNSALNVNVQSSKDTYRPGEDAQLDFSVRSAGDRSEETALGVVVVDEAVEERVQTDAEFGGSFYGLDSSVQKFLALEEQVAGVTLGDLQHLDTSKPISPDLDLLAAALLRDSASYRPSFYSSTEFEMNAAELFGASIIEQLKPLKNTLFDHYVRTMQFPTNEEELRKMLSQLGTDFNSVRDPWGLPYHVAFSVDKQLDTMVLLSSGPDKRFETPDDFAVEQMNWPYFRQSGEKIDSAVKRYHQRTGKFIRDIATLREELSNDDLNIDQLYDHWGKPYRLTFVVANSQFVIMIRSGGPDKQFSKNPQFIEDDFDIWQSAIDYFDEPRTQITNALTDYLKRTKKVPQSDRELLQALGSFKDSFEKLRDPWGRPYYHTYKTRFVFADNVKLESRANAGEAPTTKTVITPVTKTLRDVVVHSVGPDGRAGTRDDISVVTFDGVVAEQPRGAHAPKPVARSSRVVFHGSSGAVIGVVTDPAGAVIPNVSVRATLMPAGQTYEERTDDRGKYSFENLPPGSYEFTFIAPGFVNAVITDVSVKTHNVIELNATLQAGAVTETVTVTAESVKLDTAVSALVKTRPSLVLGRNVNVITKSGSSDMTTPRLRQYFPETLLWQPSIETDKDGRARVNFTLADNITTWRMVVIGSTEDGRIGTSEKEIKAFQPFFVEHDPPRVLTQGDEISLPVVVRNYLSEAQNVNLEIKPESWFTLRGPAQKQTSVPAGDAKRETFDFRVSAAVKDGKQRITAHASDDNDAIEKPVSVHPDGEELSVTSGDLLETESALELEIAPTMIPDSSRGELKIYPNLLAHVVESVEAIMQRPYGCAEQTISASYPSLLLLRHYKKTGETFALNTRAQRYLNDGYSKLLNYRNPDGGFAYWANGQPNVALTAYALQFLGDASDVIAVNPDVLKETREWLLKQQRADASWGTPDPADAGARRRNVLLTAYVTRVLARTESESSIQLTRALDFLGQASKEIDEPYLLASYALAAIDAKDSARSKPLIEKLRALAHQEGNTNYWALETNTPFYGWGLAGRIETTAVVVQALARNCDSQTAACDADRKLINQGLLFLLKQKDRYGVWYSTQATVNVLDAMLLLFSTNGQDKSVAQSAGDVFVNGTRVQSVEMNDRLNNPITVDISQYLKVGKNRVEIKRAQGSAVASVQAVANYYAPWTDARDRSQPDLRLQVKFDKTLAKINDEITCRVDAARVGFRGYGMMLAEIGIPPGAEVDRSSLEAAMKDWAVSQYDVLPDRIVVYLWPKAGGVSFNFKFRPRFGLKAKSAASILYDYYNPEATVVRPPSAFTVR